MFRLATTPYAIVHDFKALIARRIVHSSYVAHHGELGSGVVFEKRKGRDNTGRRDVNRQLVLPHREPGFRLEACTTICLESQRVLLDVFR